jgi:hypothetical protein
VTGYQRSGDNAAVVDKNGSGGAPLSSGIYLVRLQAADYTAVAKLTLE